MMKKWISMLLVFLLLCPAVNALAVSARLKQVMATRSGPGTWYTEELGTLPASTAITAIEKITTSETTWVLVEFRYNGQLYRAYTGLSRMEVYGDLPLANVSGYGDTVQTETSAYYGPGTEYATRRTRVAVGTNVTVYDQEGQWALCEYKENGKTVLITLDKKYNVTMPTIFKYRDIGLEMTGFNLKLPCDWKKGDKLTIKYTVALE